MQHQREGFAPETRNLDTITAGSESILMCGGLRERTDGPVRDPDGRGRRDLHLFRLDVWVVFFLTDNGNQFGEHNLDSKLWPY
jgi:hypothetical protein